MFFSASTVGFYNESIWGKSMPKDAKKISKKQHAEFLKVLDRGGKVLDDGNGGFRCEEADPETKSEALDKIKDLLRVLRRDILDAVTGIGFRANVAGDIELSQEAAQVSQQLLDITDDPSLNAAQTYDDMRAAGMAAYRRIADSVSPDLRSAFKGLEK